MTPITHEWRKAHGFKYEDVPRSGRHWLLWIGRAIPDVRSDASDFGIEITPPFRDETGHRVFFRADYAGRYSRFLFCRGVACGEDVVRIIEAIIHPHKLADCLTPYGYATSPAQAARLKREADELHVRMMKQESRGWKDPPDDQAVHTTGRDI